MAKKINSVIKALLVLAAVFVIFNGVKAGYSPYVKQYARICTYENNVDATALLIREETVVNPSIAGVYESYVTEGDRISTGSNLGSVVTGDIDEEKMRELNQLNAEIDELNKNISEAGVLSIEDSKVDSTLNLSVGSLRYAASKNDVESAAGAVRDIKILTKRKAGVITSSTAQEELSKLIVRRDSITGSLGGTHQQIFAPTYGIYSYKMDGLEQILNYKNAMKATPEIVETYFNMAEDGAATQGVCKIVNNYKWYILFNLTEEECDGLEVGESYSVSFTDLGEKQLSGTVKNISNSSDDGKRAVLMEFNHYIENFTYARKTRVSICKEKYSGIYIPSSALRVNDGTLGVWVQNEISVEFRSVSVIFRSDDFVLARENAPGAGGFENIVLYDNIVINPDE